MQAQETNANTHVTNRQGQQLSVIARDLGVTRREFQALKFFFENNLNPKPFFTVLKAKENWFTELQQKVKKHNSRVKVIYDLKVNYNEPFENPMSRLKKPWNEHHKNFLQQAKDLYNEEGSGVRIETFVLWNCLSSWYHTMDDFNNVKRIATTLGLREAGPRALFTIGAKIPDLAIRMGIKDLGIFETMGSYPQRSGSNISWPFSCCVTFQKIVRPCLICQSSIVVGPNAKREDHWLVFRK